MKRASRWSAQIGLVLLCASNIPVAAVAVGEPAQHVLIVEVSPQSGQSATEEFIELYNPNETPVDVTGWKLQYRSAASIGDKTWTTKSTFACLQPTDDCKVAIDGHDTLHLSSYESDEQALPLSSGMALDGGQVRLLQPSTADRAEEPQDLVGYGASAAFEGTGAAPAPQPGRSIVRKQDATNAYIDTNNNGPDFELAPDQAAADAPTEPGRGASESYPAATITEVFPDPASPQLDSADEFIELYNPYDESLDLTGYVLKTGSTWSYKYTIDGVVIEPHGYSALTSAQTHLTLSNAGSGVRLFDPSGTLVAEAPSYGKAKTGFSWALGDAGQWVWTTQTTPGVSNIMSAPVEDPASAASKAAKKSTSTAKPKTTAAKSTSAKPAASAKGATAQQQVGQTQHSGGPNYLLIAAAGVLAGGYLVYEYRQEVAGFARRAWRTIRGANNNI
jgi:Lamin Tail Domain